MCEARAFRLCTEFLEPFGKDLPAVNKSETSRVLPHFGAPLFGHPGAWTYDAAGNRNDAVTDNLNRATSLGRAAVTNDILGNRITKGGTTYGWDCLNRMTSLSGNVTASYAYRADGMRVAKSTGGVTTLYRHDGQMGIEDVEIPASGPAAVTKYGLGARGVDLIERTNSSGTVAAFPIYDAHGNNVASLTRNGTGFQIGDRRTYDAWGVVRSQQSGGDPKLRYCASLGHKQDDESGLVYMRARYYEPSSGRFVSEDPGRSGANWYAYCSNDPLNRVDQSGKYDCGVAVIADFLGALAGIATWYITGNAWAALHVASLIGALLSGADIFAKKLPAWLNKTFFEEAKALNSPEEKAAEDSEAAPAVIALAQDAGRDAAELAEMDASRSRRGNIHDGERTLELSRRVTSANHKERWNTKSVSSSCWC